MRSIQDYIDFKQQEFSNHPFFEKLKQLKNLEEISYFVPELTFWAMSFQDVLRLNEKRIMDPYLKKIARHHRLEDSGHDKWFLQDKKYMGAVSIDDSCNNDTVSWLYGKENQITRDASYAIIAEVFRAEYEILNIALLLTVESSGHVFFEEVARQVKKTGEDKNLKYFSNFHFDVEMAHAVFEEEMERSLLGIQVSLEVKRDALKMINRCYDAFHHMFDGLLNSCNKRLELAKQRSGINVSVKSILE